MQCPSCGHVNIDGARFCAQCGTALSLACSSCGVPNDPASQFCTNCGTRLISPAGPSGHESDLTRYVPDELLRRMRAAQTGGAMRGERRTVTMLFADIQGSTAAAERLDPEDWAEIVNGAFEQLIAPIYRYEGTVARLLGDAILAFFGAPIAHEDDPVRAVRAAMDILDSIADYRSRIEARTGVPISVRVGINTGLVVVGEVGSDLRVEYTALGDAINVAARMEQTAEPGTVRVTEQTVNLLDGMFEVDDIGPVEVKGKAEPVRAFRVLRAVPAAEGGREATPLVGRDQERAALDSVASRLLDGIGGVCSLVGEAGIGKSRLLSAMRAAVETRAVVASRAEQDNADLTWLDGGSRSFDAALPYATFAEALRRWWDLDPAAPGGAWDRIASAIERASGASDPDAASFLAAAVGAPVPAQHAELVTALPTPVLHERTTEALSAYLEAEASRRPVLLVLDDLHWGDALSLALVERLMRSTDTVALALVLAMRPHRDDASWQLLETAGRDFGHRHVGVQLEALPEAAARELLDGLLGDAELDDAEVRRILDHAAGNPLFVEELARSIQDASSARASADPLGGHVDVPASLAGLLTARLDQLEHSARLAAQVASVIGREFSPNQLAALLDGVDPAAATAELVRRGVLVERRGPPEPVHAFRHVLIQETAYSTVLLRTRRELHARLAAYLEETQPHAIQEIARHLLEAGERERAFPYLVSSGERATRAMALSDAIQLFTTALDAIPADGDPDLVVRAHDGLGEAYGLIPDLPHASAAYQQLLDYG
ncbi:MAG TPA: adenylate/guanylate cyclase domain-containing protein, partial [Egibacteraceae bacterium]|nr:adenylate/guanylate cyclase domain-containing protein [Egibacteraceae bacterium]